MVSFLGLRGALAGAGQCHRVPFLLAAPMLGKAVSSGHVLLSNSLPCAGLRLLSPRCWLSQSGLTAEGVLAGDLGHSEILFPGLF